MKKKLLLVCMGLLLFGVTLPIFATSTPVAGDGKWYYVKSQRSEVAGNAWWTFNATSNSVVPGALTKTDVQKFTLVSTSVAGKVTIKEFGGKLLTAVSATGVFDATGPTTGWTITPNTVSGVVGIAFPGEGSGLHQGSGGWTWHMSNGYYDLGDNCTFFFYEATPDIDLQIAIDDATSVKVSYTAGTTPGKVLQADFDNFNSAINTAKTTLGSSDATAIQNAITALLTATNTFKSKVIYSFIPSTGLTTKWYVLKNIGRTTKRYLSNNGVGVQATGLDLVANNDKFLWKMVQTSPGVFDITGKLNDGKLSVTAGWGSVINVSASSQPYTFTYLGTSASGTDQYNLVGSGGRATHLDGSFNVVGWDAGIDSGSAWVFEDANGLPGAPSSVVATAGNTQASVAITPGAAATAGSASITSYTVTSSPGGITATGTSPVVVTGLTNGTAYTFTATATSSIGTGAASAVSNSVTPTAVPNAPTAVVGTSGNTQVSVAFTAPVANGTPAITGYTVTSNPGNFTATGTASPLVVTGLTNGTSYTFTVVATNANGNSVPSTASAAVIPSTVPGAPSIEYSLAFADNGKALIKVLAPSSNGGSAIIDYTATSNPGGITGTLTGAAGNLTINGLTNGTTYTFTVTARNVKGNSAASAVSLPVTPIAVATALDYTGSTWYTIRNNSGRYTPPVYVKDMGTANMKTSVLSNDVNLLWKVVGNASAAGIVGKSGNYLPTTLAAPSSVTAVTGWVISSLGFEQYGIASGGTSLHAAWSNDLVKYDVPVLGGNSWSFIKVDVPNAPTSVVATAGDAQASVAFTAPTTSSVFVPVDYTVTSNPGNFTATGTASPIVVTGLTNNTSYTFTVTARNLVGSSVASTASASVMPSTPNATISVDGSDVKVYVAKRMIQVTGTTEVPQVYTLAGAKVDATKALNVGVYIVKVANKSVKINVQ